MNHIFIRWKEKTVADFRNMRIFFTWSWSMSVAGWEIKMSLIYLYSLIKSSVNLKSMRTADEFLMTICTSFTIVFLLFKNLTRVWFLTSMLSNSRRHLVKFSESFLYILKGVLWLKTLTFSWKLTINFLNNAMLVDQSTFPF